MVRAPAQFRGPGGRRRGGADRALEAAARDAVWEGAGEMLPVEADPGTCKPCRRSTARHRATGRRGGGRSAVFSATYTRPYIAHGSIGPSCALACFDGASLVSVAFARGGPLRDAIARTLELAPARVTVRHHPGAGCYGHNGADDVALDAALVAMQCRGRTVRVRWTRQDEMTASPFGAASVVSCRPPSSEEGRVANWDMELWSGPHGQRPGANGAINLLAEQALASGAASTGSDDVPDAVGGGGNRNAVALYDCPASASCIISSGSRRCAPPRCAASAPGQRIRHRKLRRRTRRGGRPGSGGLSPRHDVGSARPPGHRGGAAWSPWAERGPAGTGAGLGIAFSRYKNRAAYLAAVAEVEIDAEVRVRRLWCVADAGSWSIPTVPPTRSKAVPSRPRAGP